MGRRPLLARRGKTRVTVPAELISNDGMEAINLSESGMKLKSTLECKLNMLGYLELLIPDETIVVEGRYVWVEQVGDLWMVGVKFNAPRPAEKKVLKTYIESRLPEFAD